MCAYMLMLRQCPGPRGIFMAMCTWCLMMTKHHFVDGITPPPPVIGMGLLGLAIGAYSLQAGDNSKGSMWYLFAISGLNAYTFFFASETPLLDSFPDAVAGTPQHRVGTIFCEVIGIHFAMLALSCCPAPMGLVLAMGALLAGMAKHVNVDGITPPLPVMAMAGGVFAICLYDLANAGKQKKAKRAA